MRAPLAETCHSTFVLVIDAIDDILKEWSNLEFQRTTLSPLSIQRREADPAMLDIDQLEKTCIGGSLETTIGNDTISISQVAPDIALTGFKGAHLPFSSLKIDEEIGKGGFAVVFKGDLDGQTVAVKKLNVAGSRNPRATSRAFREFRQEILHQGTLSHNNVVNLLGICMVPFCLVAEFVPYGNLYDYIHNYDIFYEYDMRIKIAEDLASGIGYLHSLNPPIVHVDMKSPNVMMVSISPTAPIVAKITDFGTSKKFTGVPITGRFVDNPLWLAPEVLIGKGYDMRVDTYAYGVILWELLSREDYFGDISFMSEVEDRVVKGIRPEIGKCPSLYNDIVEACWVCCFE